MIISVREANSELFSVSIKIDNVEVSDYYTLDQLEALKNTLEDGADTLRRALE